MPRYVVERVVEALNSRSQAVKGAAVHLVGMAYKPGVSDVRESPSLDIAQMLHGRGATVSYSDPFVSTVRLGPVTLDAVPIEQALDNKIDCAVITTDHPRVDYDAILRRSPVVVDTRNVFKGCTDPHIFRL